MSTSISPVMCPVSEDHVVGSDVVQAHHLDWLVRRQLPRGGPVCERRVGVMYSSEQ